MVQNTKIKILHINGDHYNIQKKSMKIYSELIREISRYFDINEIPINDRQLNSLNNCRGCKKCFNTGKCIFENIDQINEIKNQILESELIILSTPIFIDNISGNLKTLFDRLSYWFHTMPLKGKSCIIIISTYRSGVNEVSKYLYKICNFLGLEVVGIIASDYRTTDDELHGKIEVSVDILLDYLSNSKEISAYSKMIFDIYDQTYSKMLKKDQNNFESIFWKECHH